jgi:hypothetical protein
MGCGLSILGWRRYPGAREAGDWRFICAEAFSASSHLLCGPFILKQLINPLKSAPKHFLPKTDMVLTIVVKAKREGEARIGNHNERS